LDIFGKNPFSRVPNTSYQTIASIRKEIAKNIVKLERFRWDPVINKNLAKVSSLIEDEIYSEFSKVNLIKIIFK